MSGKWGRRRRYVYAYDVMDIRTPARELAKQAYIGKTSSDLRYRDAQHRASKVWAWAICGPIYPVWEGDCGRIRLWFLEVWYILTLEPLFNVEWNRNNPHRIPTWKADRLYARRDLYDRPQNLYRERR